MTQVDDAEPVAVRVGQHDEVRVVRVAIPVHPLSSEGHQPGRFRLLLSDVAHVQVQMQARALLRWRLAPLKGDPRSGAAARHERDRPAAEPVLAYVVTQRRGPELRGPPDVGDAQHDHSHRQHEPIVATAGDPRNGPPQRARCAAAQGRPASGAPSAPAGATCLPGSKGPDVRPRRLTR